MNQLTFDFLFDTDKTSSEQTQNSEVSSAKTSKAKESPIRSSKKTSKIIKDLKLEFPDELLTSNLLTFQSSEHKVHPSISETKDNKKLASQLRNHFVEIEQVRLQMPLASEKIAVPSNVCLQIASSRGLTESSINDFLKRDLENIPNPSLLKNLDQAVAIIDQINKQAGTVLIISDYDCDGLFSHAIFKRCSKEIGLKTLSAVPNRFKDGYGLNEGLVEQAIKSKCSAVILLDIGTKSSDLIKKLQDHHIKVIVIDHHTLEDQKDNPADAFINPKQLACNYPDKELCTTLLTGLFTKAVVEKTNKRGSEFFESVLGLLAAGIIADVMPLAGINRNVVYQGIKALNKNGFPALNLIQSLLLPKAEEITEESLAFYVCPTINAVGRLCESSLAVVDLLTQDHPEKLLAKSFTDLNEIRRQLQAIGEYLFRTHCLLENQKFSANIFTNNNLHPGVAGLVASYAAQQTNKPSLALYPKDDFFAGSGRQGPKEFDLISSLTKFQNLLKQFGGHTAAAGVSIDHSEIPKLLEALHSESTILPENNSGNIIQTDYNLSPNAISSKTYYEIRNFFGPFGQGNPEPIGLIDNLQVKAIDQINNKHLRLTLTRGHQEIEAIFWGLSYHPAIAIGNTIRVAGSLALNHYWNAKTDCYISLKAIELTKIASLDANNIPDILDPIQENVAAKLAQKSIRYPEIAKTKTDQATEAKVSYSYKSRILSEQKRTNKFNFPDDSQNTEYCPFTSPEPAKVKSFIFSEHQQKQIEVPTTYRELKERYDLSDFNPRSLNDSQEQLNFICNSFEHDQSILAEAATGSGKTILALVIAYPYLKKGENVIFLDPRTTLPDQAATKFREIFPKLESAVLISTGAESIQQRRQNYSELKGKIIFGTPQTIRNDFKQGLISPKQFKFVIIDECQHFSKEYDYDILCKHYFIPEKTRCLLLSAQAGISQQDIEARIKKLFVEGGANLIQDSIPVPRARINEMLIPIELNEQYKLSGIKILEVAYDFRQRALKKLETLELFDFRDQLKQISNFNQSHDPKLPSGIKLQKLGSEILTHRKLNSAKLKLESRNMLGTCASEIYAFAEALRLFNLYTAHGEALLVSTIAQKLWDINYDKFGVNFGKQTRTPYFIRLLYNEGALLEIFDQAVDCCSFSLLRANLDYDELVEKFNKLRFTETQGDLSSQLSYIKPKDFRNDFFISANRQYIINYLRKPESWHPKIKFLITDIEDKLLHNKSKGIVFTYHQEQARFLHQLINIYFKDSNLNAVLCLGKRTTNKKNEQEALDAFRTGKSRILIGTIDKVGEGLDIHDVKEAWKVESTIFRTTLAEQLPGRLGRGSLSHLNLNQTATLRHLVTAGTSEETNYQIMQKKTRRARRDLETRMLRGRRNN